MICAVRTSRSPAAIGRRRFVGCSRSASASIASLRKYVPLAARQKPTNATSVWSSASRWSSTPAAAGAANTRTFFVHCLGRAVRIAAFSVDGTSAALGVGRRRRAWKDRGTVDIGPRLPNHPSWPGPIGRRLRRPMAPKVYTRKGDDGTTGLLYGGRVGKDAAGPDAYGAVDEAVSALGLARAETERGSELDELLMRLQRELFVVGAELATAPENRAKLDAGRVADHRRMVDRARADHRRRHRALRAADGVRAARREPGRGRARRRPHGRAARRARGGRRRRATAGSSRQPGRAVPQPARRPRATRSPAGRRARSAPSARDHVIPIDRPDTVPEPTGGIRAALVHRLDHRPPTGSRPTCSRCPSFDGRRARSRRRRGRRRARRRARRVPRRNRVRGQARRDAGGADGGAAAAPRRRCSSASAIRPSSPRRCAPRRGRGRPAGEQGRLGRDHAARRRRRARRRPTPPRPSPRASRSAATSTSSTRATRKPTKLQKVIVIATGGAAVRKRGRPGRGGRRRGDVGARPGEHAGEGEVAGRDGRRSAQGSCAGTGVTVAGARRRSSCEAQRLGGVLGVGQGSEQTPRFLKMTYAPAGARAKALALVGKGVVFDSGGLSLKTGARHGDDEDRHVGRRGGDRGDVDAAPTSA